MEEAAGAVLRHALAHPPRLGRTRLVCVDGRSGAGKSTLAREVERLAVAGGARVRLLVMDDVYEGWDGLPTVAARLLDDVLGPLAEGRDGRYRRWDWVAGDRAEAHEVAPADLLVLEGVGSASRSWATMTTTTVWVEAPADVRLARAVARDGEAARPLLEQWAHAEDEVLPREDALGRADLVVDGLTGRVLRG